ncbi:MAG: lasso peptide [Bacteroidetes bacterium]|nr:lasso peptide [Bacteroidota bacterium]
MKKPYQAPRLIVHGDVEDLTKGPRTRSRRADGVFGFRRRRRRPPPGS